LNSQKSDLDDEIAPGSRIAPQRVGEPAGGMDLLTVLTWLGKAKWLIAGITAVAAVASFGASMFVTPTFTARTSLLPPGTQQQSSSAAALAALGSLGGFAGGLGGKTSDEFYSALLRSDAVVRFLDEKFFLRDRYEIKTFESLRKAAPQFIRVQSDRKTGLILIEVDDKDPKFAADLANAHVDAVSRVLSRLAVSEAQQRRLFFERQVAQTKEDLIKAEFELRSLQEKSGVIVLDKQAEALLAGTSQLRTQITDREIRLKVLRTSATEQNPDVARMATELAALQSELARMEGSTGGTSSATNMPVGKLPAISIDYLRARRELKLQETLLESMIRQFELAKLDEAKDAPVLQQIDVAQPPDYKSKPSRSSVVMSTMMFTLLASIAWVLLRRYAALGRAQSPESDSAWIALRAAWKLYT
jgi:capsule polysaccharide export protein KpsE/RkpR